MGCGASSSNTVEIQEYREQPPSHTSNKGQSQSPALTRADSKSVEFFRFGGGHIFFQLNLTALLLLSEVSGSEVTGSAPFVDFATGDGQGNT